MRTQTSKAHVSASSMAAASELPQQVRQVQTFNFYGGEGRQHPPESNCPQIPVRILINNDYYEREEVGITLNMPFVPRVGDYIRLTDEQFEILENQVKSDWEIAQHYTEWVRMIDGVSEDELTLEHVKEYLDFTTANVVVNVMFDFDKMITAITIDENVSNTHNSHIPPVWFRNWVNRTVCAKEKAAEQMKMY